MAMLRILFIASVALLTVQAVRFDIRNLEIGPVWVGIVGNDEKSVIENGGFVLDAGKSRSITVPDDWSGTLWPRTWCNWPKPNECLTGECGQGIECDGNIGKSPFSSVDITLKGKDGYDSYAVSLKNGYNVGVAVEPIKGNRNSSHHFSCSKAACIFNFQRDCPGPLRLRHENQIVGCHSPCQTFSTDEYCCQKTPSNPHVPELCRSLEWRDIQPKHFKQFCPDALTHPKDEHNIFTCKADAYRINFGGAW